MFVTSTSKLIKLKSDKTRYMSQNYNFFLIILIILPNVLHLSQCYYHIHHLAKFISSLTFALSLLTFTISSCSFNLITFFLISSWHSNFLEL